MSMKTAYPEHKSINKLRPTTRKLRDTRNVAENMDGRRRSGFEGSNNARASRRNGINDVFDDNKFRKGEHGERWNSKSSMKKTKLHFGGKTYQEEPEWKNESTSLASGYKRKRIYAEREEGPHRRGAVGWSDAKHGSNPKRGGVRGSQKNDGWSEFKLSHHHGRGAVERSHSKHRNNSRTVDLKNDGWSEFKLSHHHGRGAVERSHSKHRNNSRTVDLRSSHKNDDERNDSLKKFSKNIRESSKEYDPNLEEPADASVLNAPKRLGRDRKQLAEKPKSRKKIFRMNPNDMSNKRLLENIGVDNNRTQEIKEDPEKNVSLNAQFRAIKPSPSILSFVEENLIGRRRLIQLQRAGYNIDLSSPLDNQPLSTSDGRQRIEEPLFRNKLTFFAAAKISSSFPPATLPEIAFAGKSNVGKSSLLNALTRRWGVVRTSDKPGLTQTINFFNLEKKLCLVDLPGYGFAYAKEAVKDSWEELVKEYVSTRIGLNQVCLLIDTKWGMKPRDHELINLMERYGTQYQIVLTKTDAVFPIDVARRAMQIEESLKEHKSVVRPAMMVSSRSGAGIGILRKVLSNVARLARRV